MYVHMFRSSLFLYSCKVLDNEMTKVFYTFSLKSVCYCGVCNLQNTLECVGPKDDSCSCLLLRR